MLVLVNFFHHFKLTNTHIKSNKWSAIVCISEHCTSWATLAVLKRNRRSVELDRILVVFSSCTNMWRRPLHPYGPRHVPPFNGRPPAAWLPLKWVCWPLLWRTLRPSFSPRGLRVGHIARIQRVVIGEWLCIIWPRKGKGKPRGVGFRCGRAVLRAALSRAERVVLKVAAAGSGAHVSQGWWSRWDLAAAVVVDVFLPRGRSMCRKSAICSFCLWVNWVAVSALWRSLCSSEIHLHNLDVLLHAYVNILHGEKS